MGEGPANTDIFANLRGLIRKRSLATERCDLCAADIGAAHSHLLQTKTSAIVCSCDSCAFLFGESTSTHYRRIPREIRTLRGFTMTDSQWESLAIPINLAFFCKTGDSPDPALFYPSPAGATQSLLNLRSWTSIVDQNPALRKMQHEVECLLANRVTSPYEYYIVPIDECYRLVGLIRTKWQGFSGGKEAWQAIGSFFTSLKERAIEVNLGIYA